MSTPQAGILNRPPDHALIAAYQLNTPDPAATRAAIEQLRELVHKELRSVLDDTSADSPKDQRSSETGELGFDDGYDRYHLTATVGFASGAYEKLGIPAEERPQDLIPIPWDKLSDQPDKAENGDLVIQLCTDSLYIAEHFLRRIDEEMSASLQLAWVVSGHQRHNSRSGRANRHEGRALIGFLDGSSNLRPRDLAADRHLVFVDPENLDYPPQVPVIPPNASPYGPGPGPTFPGDLRQPPAREPAWTKEGSYMVVRASTVDISAWDDLTLGAQEAMVGRQKVSGAGLGAANDPNADLGHLDFTSDPDGNTTPLSSHVRKVNPRGPEDGQRRVFRRGYPLISAQVDGLRRGLVFICFGRTVTTQFEFITRAWTANPNFPRPDAGVDQLRQYEHVLCGGYFFMPPLRNRAKPWSWIVPEA